MNEPTRSQSAKPFTVTQLTGQIKNLLESQLPRVWVIGEISNFKVAGSGHWYFSLKDDRAQIRANMWRSATAGVAFRPRDGMEVLVSGSMNVYPPRGDYSLVVDSIQEVGLGKLRQEFERLKAKLQAEGLFDPAHKQPLCLLPRKIGIVTSPTGAALRDILRVLKERFANIHILLAPARVQGQGAAQEIAAAIGNLDRHGACDLLIVGRGGGSEEDLWAFNEEIVARAIFEAKTPIIAAVGHEVDFTIADFVADIRAATPSNAAEIAVRTRAEYGHMIAIRRKTIEQAMQRKMMIWRNRVKVSESHPIFVRVRSRFNDCQRRLDELNSLAHRRLTALLHHRKIRLSRATQALQPGKIHSRRQVLEQRVRHAQTELDRRVWLRLDHARRDFTGWVLRLDDLSPLKVLGRGYAVVFDARQRILKDPAQVRFGEVIGIRMAKGQLHARVIEDQTKAVQEELF